MSIAEKLSKKQKSVDAEKSLFKRSKFNSQSSDKIKREKKINSQTTSLYIYNNSSFDNRIFRCLIISPADRAIREFRSISELLKTLRDTIKTHRFLYINRKILYRNISKNNIIIIDSKKADNFTNILIDKNLVKKIDSGRSDARYQIDTIKFITIEMLHCISYIYRYNLELFFYVFL